MQPRQDDDALLSASAEAGVAYTMTVILVTMLAALAGIASLQTPASSAKSPDRVVGVVGGGGRYLPCPRTEPTKRAYELFAWYYTAVWIAAFGAIVVLQLYESFTANSYMVVCVGLALPFLLQPILAPSAFSDGPDGRRPLARRYCARANLWLATYSFIGNYWYTHYFYSVLQAEYTFPAHRFNDVPIALYFATHFYFSTYHALSNALLRKVETSYAPGFLRTVLFGGVVVCLSYFTAFMETLTISSFPYYTFEDRSMAYTIGSAFYGIYFLVSFPVFYYFDADVDADVDGKEKGGRRVVTLWDTFLSSCGAGMVILCLLDFVRLFLGVPLTIAGGGEGATK